MEIVVRSIMLKTVPEMDFNLKGGIKMKKLIVGVLLAGLVLAFSLGALAKPGHFKGESGKWKGESEKHQQGQWNKERNDAQYIIHRTAGAVGAAQRAAERGHRYSGLGRAIAHQQLAWDLYGQGEYRAAIYHSLLARRISVEIINANRFRVDPEFSCEAVELGYVHTAPKDNQLELQISSTKIGKDNDMVHFSLHLDISE